MEVILEVVLAGGVCSEEVDSHHPSSHSHSHSHSSLGRGAVVLLVVVVVAALLEVMLVAGCVCSEEVYIQSASSHYNSSLGTGAVVLLVSLVVVLVLVDIDNTGVEWDPQVLQSLSSAMEKKTL